MIGKTSSSFVKGHELIIHPLGTQNGLGVAYLNQTHLHIHLHVIMDGRHSNSHMLCLVQFLCLKNIKVFLQACRIYFSMSDGDLFEPTELFEFEGLGMQKVCVLFHPDAIF